MDTHYQQYLSQYTAAHIPLYDARGRSMYTVFLGEIALYDYNFATGQLTTDTRLPFVSTLPNTTNQDTQTTSSNQVFKVTLTPTR